MTVSTSSIVCNVGRKSYTSQSDGTDKANPNTKGEAMSYTIGRIRDGRRTLYRDGERFGAVQSEPGPGYLGELTASDVWRRFGRQLLRSYPPDDVAIVRRDMAGESTPGD